MSTSCGETTSPAACLPKEVIVPVTISTYSNNCLCFSLILSSTNSLLFSSSCTKLHNSCVSWSVIPKALPTSLIAPRILIVLNVTILQQYKPSFSKRYFLTFHRSSLNQSESTSARLIRSLFIKRSKFKLYLILSTSVIPKRYAIILPETEPLEYP